MPTEAAQAHELPATGAKSPSGPLMRIELDDIGSYTFDSATEAVYLPHGTKDYHAFSVIGPAGFLRTRQWRYGRDMFTVINLLHEVQRLVDSGAAH